MIQRVTASAVLSERRIGIVRMAGLIQRHVFNDGTKANGIPNDRLIFLT